MPRFDGARKEGERLASTKTFLEDDSGVRTVWVEVSLRDGPPMFEIAGFSGLQTREVRERLRAAVVNSGFGFPLERVVVHVSLVRRTRLPGELDLAMAAALLSVSGQLVWSGLQRVALISELALDGSTLPIQGIQAVVEQARRSGDEMIVVPGGCAGEATRADGIAVREIESLSQLPLIAPG